MQGEQYRRERDEAAAVSDEATAQCKRARLETEESNEATLQAQQLEKVSLKDFLPSKEAR